MTGHAEMMLRDVPKIRRRARNATVPAAPCLELSQEISVDIVLQRPCHMGGPPPGAMEAALNRAVLRRDYSPPARPAATQARSGCSQLNPLVKLDAAAAG